MGWGGGRRTLGGDADADKLNDVLVSQGRPHADLAPKLARRPVDEAGDARQGLRARAASERARRRVVELELHLEDLGVPTIRERAVDHNVVLRDDLARLGEHDARPKLARCTRVGITQPKVLVLSEELGRRAVWWSVLPAGQARLVVDDRRIVSALLRRLNRHRKRRAGNHAEGEVKGSWELHWRRRGDQTRDETICRGPGTRVRVSQISMHGPCHDDEVRDQL